MFDGTENETVIHNRTCFWVLVDKLDVPWLCCNRPCLADFCFSSVGEEILQELRNKSLKAGECECVCVDLVKLFKLFKLSDKIC